MPKRFKGRKEFLEFKSGKLLSASLSIRAYCFTCMSEYADGAGDCGDKNCPLHPFMPYNENKVKRRVVSEATKEKMRDWRKKK